MNQWTLAVVLFVAALCALPEQGFAQYHGVTHHRVSRRASRVQRPGWQRPHGQTGVPELDPGAAGAALALLGGGALVLLESRKRRGQAV